MPGKIKIRALTEAAPLNPAEDFIPIAQKNPQETRKVALSKVVDLAREAMPSSFPTGAVVPYAGMVMTDPEWLICSGQSLLRADYPELYTTIGNTYGSASSKTFNLPDMRGVVPAGKDNMNGTTARGMISNHGNFSGTDLGDTGGAESHKLTENEMPKHFHRMRGPNSITAPQSDLHVSNNIGFYGGGTADDRATEYGTFSTGNGADSGATSTGTGEGSTHNNLQPTIILNYIIKI